MSGKVEVKPGLFKETLKQGNPANPVRAGDSVTVHCTGVIAATGKKFWRYGHAHYITHTYGIDLHVHVYKIMYTINV